MKKISSSYSEYRCWREPVRWVARPVRPSQTLEEHGIRGGRQIPADDWKLKAGGYLVTEESHYINIRSGVFNHLAHH